MRRAHIGSTLRNMCPECFVTLAQTAAAAAPAAMSIIYAIARAQSRMQDPISVIHTKGETNGTSENRAAL